MTSKSIQFCLSLLFTLSLAHKTLDMQLSQVSSTLVKSGDFDGNCFGCIVRGFAYCLDFNTCLRLDQTCPKGLKVNNQTGCPIARECNFGYRGVAYLSEGEQFPIPGGYGSEGKAEIEVPMNRPCYISLVNSRRNNFDIDLKGENITAYKMIITYPFNVTNYTQMSLG